MPVQMGDDNKVFASNSVLSPLEIAIEFLLSKLGMKTSMKGEALFIYFVNLICYLLFCFG